MFATGIENTYPTILLPGGTVKRVDELEKTSNYQQWKTDFKLVTSLGISYLRQDPPYYKTNAAPGKYDWEFADDTFKKLQELNITPIVNLLQFGVPGWIGKFQNLAGSWFYVAQLVTSGRLGQRFKIEFGRHK